ncbi:UBA-like_superfamily [Hexamita inflata]|uniref:UBA-like superfamily n=1 Tax=Hexamita inflata TaxID=28002 RepID=A0AA86NDL0_9EUKA|nr:UBA-like superfamily [Hexamita inflata]
MQHQEYLNQFFSKRSSASEKINNFVQITKQSNATAKYFLTQAGFDLQLALVMYIQQNPREERQVNMNLGQLVYFDRNQSSIYQVNNIQQFEQNEEEQKVITVTFQEKKTKKYQLTDKPTPYLMTVNRRVKEFESIRKEKQVIKRCTSSNSKMKGNQTQFQKYNQPQQHNNILCFKKQQCTEDSLLPLGPEFVHLLEPINQDPPVEQNMQTFIPQSTNMRPIQYSPQSPYTNTRPISQVPYQQNIQQNNLNNYQNNQQPQHQNQQYQQVQNFNQNHLASPFQSNQAVNHVQPINYQQPNYVQQSNPQFNQNAQQFQQNQFQQNIQNYQRPHSNLPAQQFIQQPPQNFNQAIQSPNFQQLQQPQQFVQQQSIQQNFNQQYSNQVQVSTQNTYANPVQNFNQIQYNPAPLPPSQPVNGQFYNQIPQNMQMQGQINNFAQQNPSKAFQRQNVKSPIKTNVIFIKNEDMKFGQFNQKIMEFLKDRLKYLNLNVSIQNGDIQIVTGDESLKAVLSVVNNIKIGNSGIPYVIHQQ